MKIYHICSFFLYSLRKILYNKTENKNEERRVWLFKLLNISYKRNMNYTKTEIKQGINLHNINTNKFKTNLFAVFLATPLTRENVTKTALLAAVLRRGTNNIKSQDLISKKLEEMYGASFDCGIEKTGDNHIIKFYLEAINEDFLPQKEELNKKSIDILFDIIFNPLAQNGEFNAEYVESEKAKLKQIIEGKIDNKRAYSFERCIEEMFKGEAYGLYKFGYIEDLEKITAKNLYEYYKELLQRCKIDIFVSGNFENNNINEIIKNNEEISKLEERKPEYIVNKEEAEVRKAEKEKVVEEKMKVGQGNLVIGLSLNSRMENEKFVASVYNAILGGGANSKLFQNVREKNSLAYTAGSTFRRQKNTIFVRCGIEIDNYNKALETIKEQIEDMKNGEFTTEDIENAKKLIIASVKGISSEQDTEITYYYGQELSDSFTSIEEYIDKISKVSKDNLLELAKEIWLNTIYFLRD